MRKRRRGIEISRKEDEDPSGDGTSVIKIKQLADAAALLAVAWTWKLGGVHISHLMLVTIAALRSSFSTEVK